MLPISCRSKEGAQPGTSPKLMVCRGREAFGDAYLNISGTFSTAVVAVEDINPVDGKCLAVVNSKPRIKVSPCVTHFTSACDPINAVGS